MSRVNPSPYLFDVLTPLGFRVHCTQQHWAAKVVGDHPVMAGREADVMQTLSAPSEVRLSRVDDGVFLFYTSDTRRLVCAVARRTNGDGFLITAYPTDSIKKGEVVWTK